MTGGLAVRGQPSSKAAARGEERRKASVSRPFPGKENPVSGEFGLQQGPSEVASVGPVKRRSTKKKAPAPATGGAKAKAVAPEAGCLKGGALAAAGCVGEVAPAAVKVLPTDEVVWVMSQDGRLRSVNPDGSEAEAPAAWKGMTRLPKEEVDMILSLDVPRIELYDDETLRRLFPQELIDKTREPLREAAEVLEEVRERSLEFQNWVRGELEEKDYVEVPDKFLADREEIQEWMQEEIDQMFDRLNIPDRYFASDDDDK